ncbi:trimeric intracellular cation channel family protein [Trichlorobacter lovleyi]|uniref:trimeric intracellular cation channel family protein n=1 Tax=Trichlorobacter lovleyi TaxID=313985 RepID=UPI00223FF9BD|nr:trimeric intracellular cation channel family protein [Trichlorobacter lovleyi]QOX79985.1 trimeric intracellular cation channel family protein [Trichlorobacter lovleyi]
MSFLYSLDLLGTAAFAASGALAAIRREMDLFGVLMLGLVTACGGGTLRDLLLGDTPPFIFKDETYLYLSVAVALLVFIFRHHLEFLHHPLPYFDAVGLGTFVVIGTGKALEFKLGLFGSVMMGVMTATAGGMIRDLLSAQVPMVLQREVYASACLAGGTLLYLLHRYTNIPHAWSLLAAALLVISMRLLAIRYNWALPRANDFYRD